MDIEFLLAVGRFREATGHLLDGFMLFVSELISGVWVYPLVAAVYWCLDKKAGQRIALSVVGGLFVNQGLKNTFCVYRPWVRDPRVVPVGNAIETATGYSFPSGHTQIAVTMFGSLALWQRRRRWFSWVMVGLLCLVPISRVYLSVHTPQDVLVSLALAGLAIYASGKLLPWVETGKNRDLFLFFAGLVICGLYLLYIELRPYPVDFAPDGQLLVDPEEMVQDCYSAAGCLVGFLSGWLLERRCIRFTVPKEGKKRLLRLLVGAGVLLVIAVFLEAPFVLVFGANWGTFFRFTLAFFWVIAGAPRVFGLYEKRWFSCESIE
ncbi:MAG: phosphatase PAP2 family protein [Clostridia bacterium]|nr:phosphatase PAP2 family protein [Clostridia bacterium]